MRANVSYTSREQVEVYKFSLPVSVGVPLVALLLQSFLPVKLHFMGIFDFPLLVTIFFAVARRNPLTGLATGAIIGIVQDSLTTHLLGAYGIAKTIIGYVASSLGVKIDVENPGSRLLMTMAFYILHGLVFFAVMRGMAGQANTSWRWAHELGSALANGLLAIVLFAALDRFRQRA